MKLSTILRAILVAYMAVNAFLYLLIGQDGLVDSLSMIYLSLIVVFLIIYSRIFENSISYPLMVLFVIYVFQRYCLSSIGFFLFPTYYSEQFRHTYYGIDYNRTILYALFGTIFAGFALKLVSRTLLEKTKINLFNDIHLDRIITKIDPKTILVYVIIIFSTDLIRKMVFETGYILGEPSEDEFNFLRIFLRKTIPIKLVVLFIFLFWKKWGSKEKLFLVASFVIISSSFILDGSRSFLYAPLMMLIMLATTIYGNFLIRGKQIAIFLAILIISVFFFPISTAIRYSGYTQTISYKEIAEYVIGFYFGSINPVSTIIQSLFDRLSEIESPMMIMSDKFVMPIGDLMSLEMMVKRIINNLVPGDLFDGVLAPQYLFQYIYYGSIGRFNAPEWGIWENLYLMFGYWGGLFSLFVIMVIIGLMWKALIIHRVPGKPFVIVAFLYYYQQLLVNYELSYVISSAIVELIVFFVFVQIISFFKAIGSTLRR